MWLRFVCVCLALACASAMASPRIPRSPAEDELSWIEQQILAAQNKDEADATDEPLSEIEQQVLAAQNKDKTTTTDKPLSLIEQQVLAAQNKTEAAATECTTSDDQPGVCVKRTQCDLEGDEEKVDPASMFDEREGSMGNVNFDREKEQCDWMKICCPPDKVLAPPELPEPPTGCGYSNPGVSVFRSDPEEYGIAEYGDFPWMVALMLKNNDGESYIGGGSIIHLSVVMTAAHKLKEVKNPQDLTCRAGEYDTRTTDEAYKHQDRTVQRIVKHERFNKVYHHNNVALLFLETPFERKNSPHIGVACLSPTLPSSGTTCYSMGWGKDFTNDNKYAVLLKKVKLGLMDASTCQTRLRGSRLGDTYKLDKSLTCAGGVAGVDTCKGDGGSPLVCSIQGDNDKVRYSVVGMVSYGLGCGTELPGVYVKIPELYTWISNEMNKAKLENKFSY